MSTGLAGSATGIGSHPGTDIRQACQIVLGESPIPYLPELPARGIGADMVGRAVALLVDIPVDASTTGYRVGARRSGIARAASDFLHRDLDAFEEACEVARLAPGSTIKVQAAGPFTLAGSLELPTGHRIPKDPGALRDVIASLTEGLVRYVDDVRGRTGGSVVLQLDEPMLGHVLDGRLPKLSKLDPIAPLPAPQVIDAYRDLIARIPVPVVAHSCAPRLPWEVLLRSGFAGISFDATPLLKSESARTADYDRLAAVVDAGVLIGLGVVPSVDPGKPGRATDADYIADDVSKLFERIGFHRSTVNTSAYLTPTCGFAGAAPAWPRTALTLATRTVDALRLPPT